MTIHHYIRTLATGAAISVATASGAPAAAQSPAPRPELRAEHTPASTLEGELISVDPLARTIVVRTANGRKERLRYTEMTLVKGAERRVAGLVATDATKVTVRYAGHRRDRIASEITVRGSEER